MPAQVRVPAPSLASGLEAKLVVVCPDGHHGGKRVLHWEGGANRRLQVRGGGGEGQRGPRETKHAQSLSVCVPGCTTCCQRVKP